MTENERIRRELSFGLGEPQDMADMAFIVREVKPELDAQTWERIVLELDNWPRDEL